jgi:hypothetical protein
VARPPLGLGKHGSIRVTSEGGQWVARCRFRQPNGQTVRVERWASSKTAATNNLQDELRNRAGERTTMLSASSRFADAAEIYLIKIADRREDSTYDTYRHWMDNVVLPALGQLRIHECDVAQFDAYFTTLQQRGYAANPPHHHRRNNAAGRPTQGGAEQPGPRARTPATRPDSASPSAGLLLRGGYDGDEWVTSGGAG